MKLNFLKVSCIFWVMFMQVQISNDWYILICTLLFDGGVIFEMEHVGPTLLCSRGIVSAGTDLQ